MAKNLCIMLLCVVLVFSAAALTGCSLADEPEQGAVSEANSDTGGIVGQDPNATGRELTAEEVMINEPRPEEWKNQAAICEYTKSRKFVYADDEGKGHRFTDVKYVPEREDEFMKRAVESAEFKKVLRPNMDNMQVFTSIGPYTTTNPARFASSEINPDDQATELYELTATYGPDSAPYLISVVCRKMVSGKYQFDVRLSEEAYPFPRPAN